jgi:hypothetical protein
MAGRHNNDELVRSDVWQTVIDATENDAAVASAQLKPQYVVSPDPCLPNKRLRPVWRQAYLVSEAAD